jgi:putative flavoprotein involved in K+ transport
VIASGGQSIPKRPPLAGSLPSGLRQLHTSDYRTPGALPAGAVLVVGSAQSGVQVAEDLVQAGRTTYLATSPVARLRRRYRGRDTLGWLIDCGFYDVSLEELPDPRMAKAPIPQISGVGRYGHTVSLQSLADLGVQLLGRPVGVQGDRIEFDESLGENIAAGDRGSAMLNGIMDGWIERMVLAPAPVEPDRADAPHPDPMSVRARTTIDIAADDIGAVVWATGYEADFGYVRVPVLDAAGLPVHAHGAARVPGIHFLGLRWLNDRKSALITAADAEAGQMADRVAGIS